MSSSSAVRHLFPIACLIFVAQAAVAADLASIVAEPLRGQSADRARRDRYECHNWAVAQTGRVPGRSEQAEAAEPLARAERIDRVITGAGIGATVGGLARATQNKNPSHGVLAGGVIGAAVGALIGRDRPDDETDEVFDEYFRALSACLEARGYRLSVDETVAASRNGR